MLLSQCCGAEPNEYIENFCSACNEASGFEDIDPELDWHSKQLTTDHTISVELEEPFKTWKAENLADLDIPTRWFNTSWKNDVHPSFENGDGLKVYIGAGAYSQTEYGASENNPQGSWEEGPNKRFSIQHSSWVDDDHWLVTNDFWFVRMLMNGSWKLIDCLDELRQEQGRESSALEVQLAVIDIYTAMIEAVQGDSNAGD